MVHNSKHSIAGHNLLGCDTHKEALIRRPVPAVPCPVARLKSGGPNRHTPTQRGSVFGSNLLMAGCGTIRRHGKESQKSVATVGVMDKDGMESPAVGGREEAGWVWGIRLYLRTSASASASAY